MKNVAVIFAGGVGARMNSKDAKPKQFLMVHGKPIIVHTIEIFERSPEVDAVVVVCIESWISYMEELLHTYQLTKVSKIVPGGETGQASIFHGLEAAEILLGGDNGIVLIHDGVRPFINQQIIADNIESVRHHGSAITCSRATETFVITDEKGEVVSIPSRDHSRIAKAPQSFYLKDILAVHRQALADGVTNAIDSCTLMNQYGKKLAVVMGPVENIKITTPEDFMMARALLDAIENQQIDRI
ncbi:MAG: IspD/TarI family cytidylyltransferase [Bacillota bacterium]|nr:IspD/TarI family cytidylyltransferase [Bacillota bacterium]MDW7676584.1 IspD/TarI family cytidylyltransferase [Bacillota bacterium]